MWMVRDLLYVGKLQVNRLRCSKRTPVARGTADLSVRRTTDTELQLKSEQTTTLVERREKPIYIYLRYEQEPDRSEDQFKRRAAVTWGCMVHGVLGHRSSATYVTCIVDKSDWKIDVELISFLNSSNRINNKLLLPWSIDSLEFPLQNEGERHHISSRQ